MENIAHDTIDVDPRGNIRTRWVQFPSPEVEAISRRGEDEVHARYRRMRATGELPGGPVADPPAQRGRVPIRPGWTRIRERSTEASPVHILSADEFFAEDKVSECVVPHLGICAGPPTGIVGEAYAGKTLVATSAGLSVATGLPLWGQWKVKAGVWLHLDYEQGRRHTKARILRLARGMGVDDDELRQLIATGQIRIAVYPELNLTTEKATDQYRKLFDGVALVTCDSLRVMLGNVDENSSQVRPLMQHLTHASDPTGAAVVLAVHSGKPPATGATSRTRKHMARGSSAIVDELQTKLVITKKKSDPVALVTHEKDRELGETVPDFGLRIEDVADATGHAPKWGLRVVAVDTTDTSDDLVSDVLDYIRAHPGVEGGQAVSAALKRNESRVRAAIKTLIARRLVEPRKGKTPQGYEYFAVDG